MSKFLLSWVIVGKNGGNKQLPSWEEVNFYLNEIKGNSGSVTLDLLNSSDMDPPTLQVQAEEGNYILSLAEDNGEDYIIRSYHNTDLAGQEYELLGNIWNGSMICTDFDLVKVIFKEFFDTGKVNNPSLEASSS